MTFEEICSRWQPHVQNREAALVSWDNRAAAFSTHNIPGAEDSLAMRLILEKKLVKPGDQVLDVGCGAGRFAFALERLGAKVLGVDFSPRMIAEAERCAAELGSAARFRVLDWQDADLLREGLAGRFDFVLANMTPAICSADTFLKLTQAGRGHYLMTKHHRREASILDPLRDALGLTKPGSASDDSMLYAFELLWLQGLRPQIFYEDKHYLSRQTTEDAIRDYTLRMQSSRPLTPAEEDYIRTYLNGLSRDGWVEEKSDCSIAALYWRHAAAR